MLWIWIDAIEYDDPYNQNTFFHAYKNIPKCLVTLLLPKVILYKSQSCNLKKLKVYEAKQFIQNIIFASFANLNYTKSTQNSYQNYKKFIACPDGPKPAQISNSV